MKEAKTRPTVRQLWPLLAVRNIERSATHYCEKLGFTIVDADGESNRPKGWCRLERGGSSIMLQQSDDEDGDSWGRGVSFYFVCDDAEAMHAELSARGLELSAPRVASYGMKQLFVPEPDGYSICFESPV
jgi:uncharacterized glyoxalase superfamily protein PhnB